MSPTTLVHLHSIKNVNGRSSSSAGNPVVLLIKLFLAMNTSGILGFPDLPPLI
jgi:hypothetical protein